MAGKQEKLRKLMARAVTDEGPEADAALRMAQKMYKSRFEPTDAGLWDFSTDEVPPMPPYPGSELPELPELPDEDDVQDFTPSPGDIANAERFIAEYGEDIRYVPQWNSWLLWDGHRWTSDDTLGIEQRAKAFAQEFAATSDSTEAKRLQGVGGRKAMVETARSDPSVMIQPGDMDNDHMLLNPEGDSNRRDGTIDLRTGKARPENRDDLLTKMSAARYHPALKCPLWEQTLREVLVLDDHAPDLELIQFFQRFAGYCLSGSTKEHAFLLLYGDGANGKGVIMNTLSKLLGDYGGNMSAHHLLVQRHEEHSTWKMDFFGRRLMISQETDKAGKLNEAIVKMLVSSDPITGRRMYENNWTFMPTHKMFMATNDLPEISGTDEGIWRRIYPVPFLRVFEKKEQDADREARLVQEYPGILNWMIQGCLDWQAKGLDAPEVVLSARENYREKSDEVRRFIRDRCNVGDAFKDAHVLSGSLYRAYLGWAEYEGIDEDRRMVPKAFGEALDKLGYPVTRLWSKETKQQDRVRLQIMLKEVTW